MSFVHGNDPGLSMGTTTIDQIFLRIKKQEEDLKGLEELNPELRPYPFYVPSTKQISLQIPDSPDSYAFPSRAYRSVLARLRRENCLITCSRIDKKVLFIIENYFLADEEKQMRDFAELQSYPVGLQKDSNSKKQPVKSLSFQTTQDLLRKPPEPLSQFYKFISTLSSEINVEITLHPLNISFMDSNNTLESVVRGVNTNKIDAMSFQTEKEEIHQDYIPHAFMEYNIPLIYDEEKIQKLRKKIDLVQKKVDSIEEDRIAHVFNPKVNKKIKRASLYARLSSFQNTLKEVESQRIDLLTVPKKTYHPNLFVNGEKGRPLVMTLLFYTTKDNFNPAYGLGTSFYSWNGLRRVVECKHMKIVFFRGDISHSLAASNIPEDVSTSRVSWVFKLIMNPTKPTQNVENDLENFFTNLSK